MLSPRTVTSIQLSFRAASAAGLAVGIAQWLQLEFPLHALLSAVLVIDLPPSKTIRMAWQRMAGTVIGATVGSILTYVLPAGPLAVGVSILLAMLLSNVAQLPGAAKVAGYVCGIVVMSHGAHAWWYSMYRVVETFLGIAMAVLVSLVPVLMKVEVPDEPDF